MEKEQLIANQIEEELMVTYSTKNYSFFKLFKSNREADHVSIIKKSIEKKDLTKYVPILVTKEGHIIDGQNRFFACQELGKKIYFFEVEEGTESDMIQLNSCAKQWTSEDYLHHYVQQEIPEYIRFYKIKEETGLTLSTILYCGAYIGGGAGRAHNMFKDGNLKLKSDYEEILRATSLIFNALKSANKMVTDKVCCAIIAQMISKKQIDVSKMCKKINTYPHLVEKKGTTIQFSRLLKKIYDYRENAANHVFSKDEKED